MFLEPYDIEEKEKVRIRKTQTEAALKRVLYCLDGRRVDLTNGNTGDANEWLRHIDKAYSEYVDSQINLEEAEKELRNAKLRLLEKYKNG